MKHKNSKKSTRNKRTKKKTNRQKKSIKNRKQANKYIQLFNLSLNHMYLDNANVFTKDDYLLLSYFNQGSKKGYKILKDKNIVKEIKCNSLCMTISILNQFIEHISYHKLTILQKLYLFFISYLIYDKHLTEKEVSLKHALRKIDARITREEIRYNKYKKENNTRGIKKSEKFIERQKTMKKQLIDSNGVNKTDIFGIFRLDVCNNIDCEYLHEYKMNKNTLFNRSYAKFCLHVSEIFKGIVWLNMVSLFTNTTNPRSLPIMNTVLPINIDIREAVLNNEVLLIPSKTIYNNDIFYNSSTMDKIRKRNVTNQDYWVYSSIDNVIYKKPIRHLENKYYITAQLYLDVNFKKSEKEQLNDKLEIITNFLKGVGKLPILKEINKEIRNIGGKQKYDLHETIDNSITSHWLYIHRDRLNSFILEEIYDN
jgi:hypothetical protein